MLKRTTIMLFSIILSTNVFSADNIVMTEKDIEWGLLNPLRGDKSPKAADLYGDRTKDVATGMLVKFEKGFSSPPHIHNITYRGVVIKGMMHNDDPKAETMWLPKGSFWTQPAGENHITAAGGEENLIYLEIDSGPYLVLSSEKAFDNGERPINIEERNLVWLDSESSDWLDSGGGKISFLWGDTNKDYGAFVKLPANFKGEIEQKNKNLKAVVVSGEGEYNFNRKAENVLLTPSSFFSANSYGDHNIVVGEEEMILYIRTTGEIEISD